MFLRVPFPLVVAVMTATLATLSTVTPVGAQGKTTGTPLTTGTTGVPTTGTTGPTTGTTGPTTGTTGPTTGTTGGFSYTGNHLILTDLTEHRSADTYAYDSGTSSWQHLTGRPTAGMKITSEPGTYGGTPPSNVSSITHSESLFVEQGTEIGAPSGVTLSGGSATGGVPVYGAFVSTGNSFYVQTSDTGAIPSGRHLSYWFYVTDTTVYNDGTPTSSSSSWARSEVVLVKLDCDDASIDTRRTYGQANKGGELPADPNAPLRFMNFGDWDYKGGDFIGNAPPGSNDSSGASRLQLYVQGGSTYSSNYIFAALSMFDKGKPNDSMVAGNIDTGVYFPSSSDTNLSVSPTSVNWDTKWSITAGPTSTTSTDWTQHPFVNQTLTNGNSDDYVVFRLTPLGGGTKPAQALYNICVAMVSEQDIIDFQSRCWHYFASQEYETGSTYPRNDCAPRVWVIVTP